MKNLKSVFKSEKATFIFLFSEPVLKMHQCTSPSEIGHELKAEKNHFKDYVLKEESSFIDIMSQKSNLKKMKSELLKNVLETTCTFLNVSKALNIKCDSTTYRSEMPEAQQAVAYLNQLQNIIESPIEAKNIACFWYNILRLNYTGQCQIITPNYSRFKIEESLGKMAITQKQLDDYIVHVVLSAGTSGLAGMRSILRFANQENLEPNAFALFEAGEIYYYGRLKNGEPDFEKALSYYKKAAELNFPLACWSIGYMYQKYNQKDPITGKKIEFELEGELKDDIAKRHMRALSYFMCAAQCDCGAAFNSIGNYCTFQYKILESLWDDLYPEELGYNEAKEKDKIQREPIIKEQMSKVLMYYYEKAAKLGDANGMYNYYRLSIKNILSEKNEKKQSILFYNNKIKLVEYLQQLIELEYPAACNDMALHLLKKTNLEDNNLYLFQSNDLKNFNKAEKLLKLAADKNGAECFPWAKYNYAFYILKELEKYEKAIDYFDKGSVSGDNLCIVKCCKEIFECIRLSNLSKTTIEYFNEKYCSCILRVIDEEKKSKNGQNSSVFHVLYELSDVMSKTIYPMEWLSNALGVRDEKNL